MGEIYLSPIGLSLVTKVAPKPILSMMMGLWFLSSFFGNFASGQIGTLYDLMPKENFFGILTAIGVITGVIFMLIRRPIEKAIGRHV
jgi:POT family proton-dependent oligopeptide transporter